MTDIMAAQKIGPSSWGHPVYVNERVQIVIDIDNTAQFAEHIYIHTHRTDPIFIQYQNITTFVLWMTIRSKNKK
jgi:hypothetical protein